MLNDRAFSESLFKAPPPDSLFVSAYDDTLTYAAFASHLNAAVDMLHGMFDRRQTLVFVVSENSVGFVVALFALNYLGQIVVPLFAGYASEEMRALYDVYKPSLVISDKRFHPMFLKLNARVLSFEDLVSTQSRRVPTVHHDQDDICFILLTSGARGPAKGVVLTNRNVLSDIIGIQDYMQVGETERCLITRSLTHASGMVGELLLTALTGGSCVLRGTPNTIRRIFEWCDVEAVTWMGVSPALLELLVDYGRLHRRALNPRRVVVSGSILSSELCVAFLETFPHTELINAYGLTEASPRVAYLPPSLAPEKPGAVGYPILGCSIRVMNEHGGRCEPGEIGEVEVAGENVMRGYFPDAMQRTPEKTTAWLRTGDLGYQDTSGALYIVGRLDALVVHNGLNIHPEYISLVFEKCPAVHKAEIAQVRHGKLTGKLFAFVELCQGVSRTEALNQIRDHLIEHLDTRKHPDEIVIVSSLPLTPSGKIDVKKLLEEHCLRN